MLEVQRRPGYVHGGYSGNRAEVYVRCVMGATLNDDPVALTSGGKVVAGITHVVNELRDPKRALELALRLGRPVFIGVELTAVEADVARRRLDDALAEIVARVPYRDRG